MADITKEPWMDPLKNDIAANKRMEGTSVKAVLLVGPDGEPYASNGGSLTVNIGDKGENSAVTSVAAAVADTLLKAANDDRVELIVENDSATADLYIKYGSGASTSSFTKKLEPGDALAIDTYTGVVHGYWSVASGNARVTEVTL